MDSCEVSSLAEAGGVCMVKDPLSVKGTGGVGFSCCALLFRAADVEMGRGMCCGGKFNVSMEGIAVVAVGVAGLRLPSARFSCSRSLDGESIGRPGSGLTG